MFAHVSTFFRGGRDEGREWLLGKTLIVFSEDKWCPATIKGIQGGVYPQAQTSFPLRNVQFYESQFWDGL